MGEAISLKELTEEVFYKKASQGVIDRLSFRLGVSGSGMSPDGFKQRFENLGGDDSARVIEMSRLVRCGGTGEEFFAVSIKGKATPQQAKFVAENGTLLPNPIDTVHQLATKVENSARSGGHAQRNWAQSPAIREFLALDEPEKPDEP